METLILQSLLGEGKNDFLVYDFPHGGSILLLLSPEFAIPVAASYRESRWTVMDRFDADVLLKGVAKIPLWAAKMYQSALHAANCTGHYCLEEREQLNRILECYGLSVSGSEEAPFLNRSRPAPRARRGDLRLVQS
jgi:hypothetical protein